MQGKALQSFMQIQDASYDLVVSSLERKNSKIIATCSILNLHKPLH